MQEIVGFSNVGLGSRNRGEAGVYATHRSLHDVRLYRRESSPGIIQFSLFPSFSQNYVETGVYAMHRSLHDVWLHRCGNFYQSCSRNVGS